jgi:hypothetical protein
MIAHFIFYFVKNHKKSELTTQRFNRFSHLRSKTIKRPTKITDFSHFLFKMIAHFIFYFVKNHKKSKKEY